jgi:hypothetical protein
MRTLQDLRIYLAQDELGHEVGDLIQSSHVRAQWSAVKGHHEGTIRAALFAVLRQKLPRDWLVEAESPYPTHKSPINDRADVMVWSPDDEPLAFEVKPSDDLNRLRSDVGKLSKHVNMKSSRLQYGVVAFFAYRTNLAMFAELRKADSLIQVLPIPVK